MEGRPCYFEFQGEERATCFCQLAGNPGCAGAAWACGGTGAALQHPKSVTFRNIARARGCANPTALLTIPKSYFKHIQFLMSWCPPGAVPLLSEMIREGFLSYQQLVAPGTVRQCIHAGFHVSVPWLHLHTVCSTGVVDQMLHTDRFAYCHTMSSPAEADALAAQIIAWAGGPKDLSDLMSLSVPSSCSDMGCGMSAPAHHCSCSWNCPTFGNCCDDFRGTCLHTCKQMGCGNFISGSSCACNSECKVHSNCCEDYKEACPEGSLQHRSAPAVPSTCVDMGCGRHIAGAHCSCNAQCKDYHDCCEDYDRACPVLLAKTPRASRTAGSSCKEMGCGRHIIGGSCSCNARCKEYNDCCEDYRESCSTCKDLGCGEESLSGTCFCNEMCQKYGDCCTDYNSTCTLPTLL